jgi:serine-type D-Ala-D-Ala carboxypeptidase/endopeptidase
MTRQTAFLFSFLIGLFSNSYAQNGVFLQKQIDRALAYENRYDSTKTTGLIIGCIDHDSSWVFPFGRVAKGSNQKPDAATFFEIGSLTQTFTATNLHFLVRQGILSYDSTVNTYLKPEQRFPAGNKITLLNLITHTSGLPKLPDDWGALEQTKDHPFANYTEGAFFDFLKRLDTTDCKQGKYLFSNLNYVLAGRILENKNAAELWWQPFVDKASVAFAEGYNLASQAVPIWEVADVFEPAVGGCSNLNQLLGFVQWQLNVDSLDQKQLLEETQKAIFPTKINKNTFIGKGWHVFKERKSFPICIASGASGGHSVAIAFMPQTKTGVIILSNSREIQGVLAIAILKVLNNNWKRKS